MIRQVVEGLALTLLLVVLFSCYGPRPDLAPNDGAGMMQPGEVGPVLPGDGVEPVELEPTAPPALRQTEEDSPNQTTQTDEKPEVIENIIVEEDEKMDPVWIAFWHGVAAVLIGGAAALAVAWAWSKIKGGNGRERPPEV